MAEAEYLAGANPAAMLDFLRGSNPLRAECPAPPPSDRKLRLFAVACCRQVWHLLTDERSRRAVQAAERYADGLATAAELDKAALGVAGVHGRTNAPLWCCAFSTDFVLNHVPRACAAPPTAQAALLRCVFGNPFRPVRIWRNVGGDAAGPMAPHDRGGWDFGPSFLTPAVTALARGIYEDRAFEYLPILADALEEAGCPAGVALLSHLRERPRRWWHQAGVLCADPTPPHARGCWALDLLLGKE
jgi:hypothetical protein